VVSDENVASTKPRYGSESKEDQLKAWHRGERSNNLRDAWWLHLVYREA